MGRFFRRSFLLCCLAALAMLPACNKDEVIDAQPSPFRMLTAEQTGLHFNNELKPSADLNIFHYMYFYNGGGVAVADFNKDNLLDIYFTANQKPNALYLNKGNLKFTDVTAISDTDGDGGWSTGVTVTDINNDGWLDIYVTEVGDFKTLTGKNKLYVFKELTGDSVPVFQESAAEYGLDLVGFGTQAAFFDYDNDGDLDFFQLNHSVHHNGTFGQRKEFEGTYHKTAGDRLFRNDNGKFVEVTAGSGILSTVVGYGLGVAFSDINLDGWTDIYVTNDFHENDYLYINQQDGTFKESLNEMIRHTSRFSMGVDIADINNDGHAEIFSLDMHPEDPFILKSSLGEDDYGAFQFKVTYGYNYQYARNTLQLNNRNNTFSEIGIFSKVHASDWSWACLFADFDHDGFKDIFVSNGIPKRMNDIDYVNFASNDEIQWKIKMDELDETDLAVEEILPQIKLANKFYKNNGDLTFRDVSNSVSQTLPGFSNGAAYADFDNDGDLDIVVNNINDKVFFYENTLNTGSSQHHYISLILNGPKENPLAIGAKLIGYKDDQIMYSEQYPVRGYLSFVSPVLHLGLGSTDQLDSLLLIWPDHTYQKLSSDLIDKTTTLYYKSGLLGFSFTPTTNPAPAYDDITREANIDFSHKENEFVEFNREQLIPHMTSTEGPALAVGDLNNDGLDDFFVGSSKRNKSAIYLQTPNGKFTKHFDHAILSDSIFEDVDAVIIDVDNDNDKDLIVASGGNEYTGTSIPLRQRIYFNDGKGNFTSDTTAIPGIFMTASCVTVHDFNQDGFIDLFFGARAVPWNYGIVPQSYLLLNDRTGHFTDVTIKYAPGLANVGMVKDAIWEDMNKDGRKDLLIAVEWGPLHIFYQMDDQKLSHHTLPASSGLWNFIQPYDFDNDGDLDFVAGNLGLNSKLMATPEQPVNLFINDFDDNGQIEQIMTYYVNNAETVFPTHREVMRQLPSLKKKFLKAKDFANADLQTLFDENHINNAKKLTATLFANSYFENIDNTKEFRQHPLPARYQFSPLRASATFDLNKDGYRDIILAGNFYENNIELGKYDADYGSVMVNSANGLLQGQQLPLNFKGQVRKIESIRILGKECFLIAFNDGPLKLIRFRS